jgi:hypothetical protein
MRRFQLIFGVGCLLLAASLVGGCGGSAELGQSEGGRSGAGAAGAAVDPIGSAAGDGAAGAAGSGGGSLTPGNAWKNKQDVAPGPALTQLSEQSSGACAGTTLADAIAQVRMLRPDLSDVAELYLSNPGMAGDGSYIYAFAGADGGFALAFKRGGGDCPSGCTENDYWYFETDAACQVQAVGEMHDSGPCTPADQQPRWGVPPAVAARDICGADRSPVNLNGDYELVTCGSSMACALPGEKLTSRSLPSHLSLRIEQDPADLSQGTVTLDGTGEPVLDGQAFQATFERQSFSVHTKYDNLPATCMQQLQLDLEYDFEGFGPRTLHLFQVQTPDCEHAPSAYCKGQLDAKLGEAQRVRK